MLYANLQGHKTLASPGARAICPYCAGEVIAKCGLIKVWHWAHISTDCEMSNEPETDWHLNWKAQFPAEHCEVVIKGRRADVAMPKKNIIEFQNSTITSEEVKNREEDMVRRLVWIINAEPFINNFDVRLRKGYCTFRWKWPRKAWSSSLCPKYFDLGEGLLFRAHEIHWNLPVGGWGKILSYNQFIDHYTLPMSEQDRDRHTKELVEAYSKFSSKRRQAA